MQHLRASNVVPTRVSVSSAPSCSSHGSGQDDIESLGDVYVWGEVWSNCISEDDQINSFCLKTDVLLPKVLESNSVLDVHQIACGVRHAALITSQGELFTWGEECGGRLGHGVDKDLSRPRFVESLALSNVESVACGEYHTCAINNAGDLFTWGDGTHYTGLLGHDSDAGHWIPKRISGPLERLQVVSIACGSWHSALITSKGRLYTFGDGSFGVLGHGDRESATYPRKIQSLSGFRTIRVACGVWHTAAIVEVMGQQTGTNNISRKLFTWGDGDKYRLGHGDKETKLVPTCVSSLFDYNFLQLACGHNITVALTTSGRVLTMGSSVYGELGSSQADGKAPCVVQGRLVDELVEEIACGSHHVVVTTSRNDVYSWGRGANGRLGHGDTDNRKTPFLVHALKDRNVKRISCGSNFSACICIHKWIYGAEQSTCTGCRQAFGLTKKRYNCNHCGQVYCNACCSKKAMKAAMAPTPGKPYRVCDSCFVKLKALEPGSFSVRRMDEVTQQSIDGEEVKHSRLLLSPSLELRKCCDARYFKNELNSNRVSSPSLLKDNSLLSPLSFFQTALRPVMAPTLASPAAASKAVTTYSYDPSTQLFEEPDISENIIDSLKKANEHQDKEVSRLQGQVKTYTQKLEHQISVVHKASKEAMEAAFVAAEEAAKFGAAVKFIRTFETQIKDAAEKLPVDLSGCLKATISLAEVFLSDDKIHLSDTTMESGDKLEYQRGNLDFPTEGKAQNNDKSAIKYIKEFTEQQSIDDSLKSPRVSRRKTSRGEEHYNEQFEPGVIVTVVQLQDGTKLFKRVRFSKKKFTEQEAEEWWRENHERMFKEYSLSGNVSSDASSSSTVYS